MQNIAAILLDLGNTLLYFDGDWREVLVKARYAALQAFHQAGLQVEIGPFLNIFQETLQNNHTRREDDLIERSTTSLLGEVLTALGYSTVPDHVIVAAREAFYGVTQAHWLPETDAVPTLYKLRQQGFRLGLLSNAADDWDVQTLVDKAGVRPYMDFVLTSASFGQRKPSPAIFRAALDHWNFAPERVAMVGDTLNADILGANQMGLWSIWINRRVSPVPAPSLHGMMHPHWVISSLDELVTRLARLNREQSPSP
jgi:HAD superfamily hydrolase (TIGR01662 family)